MSFQLTQALGLQHLRRPRSTPVCDMSTPPAEQSCRSMAQTPGDSIDVLLADEHRMLCDPPTRRWAVEPFRRRAAISDRAGRGLVARPGSKLSVDHRCSDGRCLLAWTGAAMSRRPQWVG